MKKSAFLCLLLVCCTCIAFASGFFVGRNYNHVPVQASTLPNTPENSGILININTATAQQLQSLPGLGPELAERIVEYRQEHGAFRSVGDLINVEGIGTETLQNILDLITTGG